MGLKFFRLLFYRLNTQIKAQLKHELKPGDIYVCGHTHVQEGDPRDGFVNTGVNKYGYLQYGVIEGDGSMELFAKRY
jgi:predicted phosphodiesterase